MMETPSEFFEAVLLPAFEAHDQVAVVEHETEDGREVLNVETSDGCQWQVTVARRG